MRKPPTGEPYAGKPPVRFGGRGRRQPPSLPLSMTMTRPIRRDSGAAARVGGQRRGAAGPHHAALLDDVVAVGQAEQRADVLVDHQDRQALALQPGEARPDLGRISGARPSVASSRISSAGWSSARGRSPASAARRPTAGCRRLPCARAAAGRSEDALEVQGLARAVRLAAAATRFSRTVRLGKICRPSGTRPRPSRAMR